MNARPTLTTILARAAQVAREHGVTVEVEDAGRVYRIAPVQQDKPANPADLVDP